MAPITLTDWQQKLFLQNSHAQMSLSISDVALFLSESSGDIMEDVRRNRYYSIIDQLGRCFRSLVWTYNRIAHDKEFEDLFNAKQNDFTSLEGYVFFKFPRRCFYCGSKRCECNIIFSGDSDERSKADENRARARAEKELNLARLKETPPRTLDEYETMFAGIYGQGHRYSSMDSIAAHLMEEISETTKAIRHLRGQFYDGEENVEELRKLAPEILRNNFCSEVADVLSWIFALRRKSEYHIIRATKSGALRPEIPTLSVVLLELFS